MTGRREVSWNRRVVQDSTTAPPARDLATLIVVVTQEVAALRMFWQWRNQSDRARHRAQARRQIALIRALRFAIEILS